MTQHVWKAYKAHPKKEAVTNYYFNRLQMTM